MKNAKGLTEKNNRGVIEKVGMKGVTRDGMDYLHLRPPKLSSSSEI